MIGILDLVDRKRNHKELIMVKKLSALFVMSLFALSINASASVEKDFEQLKATTEKKMKVVEKKLDKMGQKISTLSGDAKEKMEEEYADLKQMKFKIEKKLASAGEMTSEKWADAKDVIEDYTDKIESRLDEAIN
jgi:hypothetical protein